MSEGIQAGATDAEKVTGSASSRMEESYLKLLLLYLGSSVIFLMGMMV